jgi:hypothetical protein
MQKPPNSLLSQLRSRKSTKQEITAASATSVIKSYIQPRLTRDYVISTRSSMTRSYCSTPVSSTLTSTLASPTSISSQLSQELFASQSSLYSTQIKLDSTETQKDSLLKNLSEYHEAIFKARITKSTLTFCMKTFKKEEKKTEEISGYAKLVKINRNLREQVENEQSVNNIRFFLYFL